MDTKSDSRAEMMKWLMMRGDKGEITGVDVHVDI